MPPIIRNAIAVFLGAIGAMIINKALVDLGYFVIPPPEGFDSSNAESYMATFHFLRSPHYVFPFLGHAIGTFVGAATAYFLASSHRSILAYSIGVFFLIAGCIMVALVPAPLWFEALDLVVAYIPMSWLAVLIGRSVTRSAPVEAV